MDYTCKLCETLDVGEHQDTFDICESYNGDRDGVMDISDTIVTDSTENQHEKNITGQLSIIAIDVTCVSPTTPDRSQQTTLKQVYTPQQHMQEKDSCIRPKTITINTNNQVQTTDSTTDDIQQMIVQQMIYNR